MLTHRLCHGPWIVNESRIFCSLSQFHPCDQARRGLWSIRQKIWVSTLRSYNLVSYCINAHIFMTNTIFDWLFCLQCASDKVTEHWLSSMCSIYDDSQCFASLTVDCVLTCMWHRPGQCCWYLSWCCKSRSLFTHEPHRHSLVDALARCQIRHQNITWCNTELSL